MLRLKLEEEKPPRKSIEEKIEYKINENGLINIYYKIKTFGLNKEFELFKDYEIDETFGKKLLEKINNIKKYYRLRIEY